MIFLRARAVVGPPEVRFAHPVRLVPAPIHKADVVGAPFKLLCIKHLTKIRVMIFTTLKMPKALIFSRLRVARLWGNLVDAYEGCHGNRYREANVSRYYLNREYGEQPSTEARFSTAAASALEMSCLFCS